MNCRIIRVMACRAIGITKMNHNAYRTRGYASATQNFDVVIVGGGPVGLALACALVSPKQSNLFSGKPLLRVALIEASDLTTVRNWSPESTVFSNRISSITNASREFLQGKFIKDS